MFFLIHASFRSHTVKLRSLKFCQALALLSCTGTTIYVLTWLTGSKMSSTFPYFLLEDKEHTEETTKDRFCTVQNNNDRIWTQGMALGLRMEVVQTMSLSSVATTCFKLSLQVRRKLLFSLSCVLLPVLLYSMFL